jgi:hypothetical protein
LAACLSIYFSVVTDEDNHKTSVSTIVESFVKYTTILTSDLKVHLINYDLEELVTKYQ